MPPILYNMFMDSVTAAEKHAKESYIQFKKRVSRLLQVYWACVILSGAGFFL